MRLEWKYTLLISVFILITMSVFFIIDDRMLKREHILSAIRDHSRGASMQDMVIDVQSRIARKEDADEITRIIRSVTLQKSGWEVADINVTDANGVVIASLTGKALYTQLGDDELRRITSGEMRVRYPPKGYYGHWVIEYTLPYIISDAPEGGSGLGALQVIFSTREIVKYIRQLRIKHLFYITAVTVALTIFINPLTSYLIVRRLERLMETITTAQAGDLGARAIDSSRDEIGRLSRSLNRMIDQISSETEERLKALGNLAAGVAHEVRNPLNSIAITIQYLKEIIEKDSRLKDHDSESEAQECLDVIARQVKELDRIVEEFLQLARPAEMDLKKTNLNDFMAGVMLDFTSFSEIKNVKLVCNSPENPLYARIDQDKLQRAISNIVLNGIQAMPNGGELYVSTAKGDSGNTAIIEIRDTGIGISQENINRLFEPYFTTKPGGTGLGLSIAYKIVEAHGGKITVKSQEGQGATFTIILPAE